MLVEDSELQFAIYLFCLITSLLVMMEDPALDAPALPPLLAPSCSSCHATKGHLSILQLLWLLAPLPPPSAGPSKGKKCCVDTPESENNDNLFAVQDDEAGADADEDTLTRQASCLLSNPMCGG
jgi:hypothetical protein